MKKLLIITLILFGLNSYGQSHDMSPGSTCKLIKTSVNTESHICPACASNDKKEKDAKNVEIKRRNDKILADAKAKKDAEQKAYQAKLAADNAEAKRKAEAAKVVVALPKDIKKEGKIAPKKAKGNDENTEMFIHKYESDGKYHWMFVSENGEEIIGNKDWTRIEWYPDFCATRTDCKKNIGIVKFGDYYNNWKPNTYHLDVVDSKGTLLFNDNNIKSIEYILDGWFLVGSFDHKKNFLYNCNTNNKIILENLASEEYKNMGLALYVPILPKIYELFTNYMSSAKSVKNNLLRWCPNFNEDLIEKYSFSLVHTNYRYSYEMSTEINTYKWSDVVVLYGITKDGKLETITLK